MTCDLLLLTFRFLSGCLMLLTSLASMRIKAQVPDPEQSASQPLPTVPQPVPPRPLQRNLFYPYAGVFCGAGATTSAPATKPTFGCGAGFSFVPLPLYTEVGIMGPQANRSYISGYVSVDTSIPLSRTTGAYLPEVLLGYSRLFETGHALDYGLAVVLPRKNHRSDLRMELRDYWTFANPNQHNVMLRIGLISHETD